tara:strand:+ start:12972 stop:13439 length:468 start_codon:yes stop_codon:yes gene_type:complete
MSRGIFKSIEYIKNMIEEILPKTDSHHGFICVNDGTGLVTNLRDRFESQREFILKIIGFPKDDGSTGLSARKRISVEVQIMYSLPKDNGFRDLMITEDTSKVIDKIKGPEYDFNNTGIVSLELLSPSRVENINDANGAFLADILILPFDLLYLEQ